MEAILGYLNAKDFGACGSSFETVARMAAGSNKVAVDDIGDFQEGQDVTISGCLPRCDCLSLFGPRAKHAAKRNVCKEVEIRNWDASNGDHVVYILDVDPAYPDRFRWSDDLSRSWHDDVPIDGKWHPLSGSLEVRFDPDFDWTQGWVVAIVMRSALTARITAIEGNTLVLDRTVTRTCRDKIVHSDSRALQQAIDTAVSRGNNLWIPAGTYRLSQSLSVDNARSLTIRGANPEETILEVRPDIAVENRAGACIVLNCGEEVELYDIGMRGSVGFDRRDQVGHLQTRGATGVWGFYFMKCNALGVWSTRRVYVENCHARKMSAECFYSYCKDCRWLDEEPANYTTSITYMRCSVEDCARNAFNNNDMAENTHIIDCRIRDVGGHVWEGASRFVIIRGCYARNAGAVAMGNVRNRANRLEQLGTGQHMIVDNTFEGGCSYGGAMITVGAAANQAIIRSNNFINFNTNAIIVNGDTGPRDLPSRNVIISANCFDMTAEGVPSQLRTAIHITASDVTVADNQIYTTGPRDENVTGIQIRDDAQGILVHDNLLRGCGSNIVTERCTGIVGTVIDDRSFYRKQDTSWGGSPPLLRRRSHRYRGWHIRWDSGGESVMKDFDPETEVFTLTEPRKMQPDEGFALYPYTADGDALEERVIHDNLIC